MLDGSSIFVTGATGSFGKLPAMQLWDVERFRVESNPRPGRRCDDGCAYDSGTDRDFLSVEQLRNLIAQELHG
jgi:hypothetical protein